MYGHSLAKARNKAGLSQRRAAAQLGVGQAYIAGLETGRNDPEILRTIVAMAGIYQCSLHELLSVPNAGEAIQETRDLLNRLSLARRKEVEEIIKLFLLLDSQDYRTEVLEDLIAGSEIFGDNRVLTMLLAARDRSQVDGSLVIDGLSLTN